MSFLEERLEVQELDFGIKDSTGAVGKYSLEESHYEVLEESHYETFSLVLFPHILPYKRKTGFSPILGITWS